LNEHDKTRVARSDAARIIDLSIFDLISTSRLHQS
jgi:hypothetical protein